MNSPEAGQNPEVDIDQEEIVAEEPVSPPKKKGWLGGLFSKKDKAESVSEEENIPEEEMPPEIEVETKLARAERLVAEMEAMTAQEWREQMIQERYEGKLGWLHAFAAGERNFTLDEDGNIRRHAFTELAQKALVTVFNKRTVTAGISLAVVGALTGGVGLPAAGALFGSMVGRGAVEAWESVRGKGKGLREDIALAEFEQFGRLQEQATAVNDLDITDEERNDRIAGFVDSLFSVDETVEEKEKELITERQVWNKRRRAGELIGGIAGMGLGIWSGLQGLTEKAMTMDINGDGVAHAVEKVNGAWHYAYNTQAEVVEAIKAGAHISMESGYATHALGEAGGAVISHAAENLSGEAAQVGAVVLGLYAGRLIERYQDEEAVDDYLAKKEKTEEAYAKNREYYGGGGGGGVPDNSEAPASTEEQQWQEAFREEDKPVPETNDLWELKDKSLLKIKKIDYDKGVVIVDFLEPDKSISLDKDGKPMKDEKVSLEFVLKDGTRKNIL